MSWISVFFNIECILQVYVFSYVENDEIGEQKIQYYH